MDTDETGVWTHLDLRCTKCDFPKRIVPFPVSALPHRGAILGHDNISIFKDGCLRCGTCRFEVVNDPLPKALPAPPPGWVPRT